MPQPWFLQIGSKEVLITRLHAGLAAFADDNSMTLPVGVQEAVMAEDFDFDRCLTRFGFSWEKARAKLQGQPDQHQEKARARAKARLSERLKNQSEVASKADYACSRECISPGACTAPCGQGPLHRNCLQSHVNHCSDSACCELPQPEPHQNIAELAGARTAVSLQLYVKCPSCLPRSATTKTS